MRNRCSVLTDLFLSFAKVGCFTFGGGWSILAQMEQEFVDKRKWITKDELLDLTAVGKSVPGIMITNISMLFGYQMGGWFGGVCSVVGISCPAIIILSFIVYGYEAFKENYLCNAALRGIRASVVPIIGSAGLSLGKEIFKTKQGRVVFAVALILCIGVGMGNITLVALSIVAALIWRGVKKHGLS